MRTVLFVDDELAIRSALKRMYADRDDIRCFFAASGEEGLSILSSEEISVVVSDHNMPGMNGIEFLSRAKLKSPDTLRLMMTAFADLDIALDAINRCEAFRFITKPWNNKALMDTVDEALDRYELVASLGRRDESLYLSLAQTVELKDPYTKGHCDRVARLAVTLAREAGLSEDILKEIMHGGWLHDCGKIGVPEVVLNHPGRLSPADMEKVMLHPALGAEVARQARMSDTVVNIILHHHERFDGLGYPGGLAGENIPIEARIVAIADVFDALYSDRPYRKAYACDKVLEIMREMTATHFDPRLMDMFICIAMEGRFDE